MINKKEIKKIEELKNKWISEGKNEILFWSDLLSKYANLISNSKIIELSNNIIMLNWVRIQYENTKYGTNNKIDYNEEER